MNTILRAGFSAVMLSALLPAYAIVGGTATASFQHVSKVYKSPNPGS
ncbi:MAG: hypothetical protein Q8N44_10870 [Rubrivivax sp.]|nr:hypothetical protein [Rubrivivax sp.]MDP3084177.1 hypothetical protein [Rubrivivax sp.]